MEPKAPEKFSAAIRGAMKSKTWLGHRRCGTRICAARVGAAAGAEDNAPGDPPRAVEVGLARLLAGVAARVEGHGADTR
jgi:hypothetical protein